MTTQKDINTKKTAKTKIDTTPIKVLKTFVHGLFIPFALGVAFFYYGDMSAAYAFGYGSFYLLLPFGIYHEEIRPEPTGFYILAMVYLYFVFIIYALEGGQYVL